MARDFQVSKETMVFVRGGEHLSGLSISTCTELGLPYKDIIVSPRLIHKEINVDDYGPNIPFDLMANLADATISIDFIHYDKREFELCSRESMGGGVGVYNPDIFDSKVVPDGTLAPAGTLIGGNKKMFASGNHFLSLSLIPFDYDNSLSEEVGVRPLRFRSVVLVDKYELPMGIKTSILKTTWRAIPYVRPINSSLSTSGSSTSGGLIGRYSGEICSSGTILWDRNDDFVLSG